MLDGEFAKSVAELSQAQGCSKPNANLASHPKTEHDSGSKYKL